jgi:hypothetical protein
VSILTDKPIMAATRHCHNCGWEWRLAGQPGRGESCHQCHADLRVCLNCISYDPKVAHQCLDRRAEPVMEKAAGNFCEWYQIKQRPYAAKSTANPREDSARDSLRKLLGD